MNRLQRLQRTGVSIWLETLSREPLQTEVQAAAELLEPVHERTAGRDGFMSFECTPDLADDMELTIEQALDLWARSPGPT